ncbi:ATP-binding protein, partial [Candidatus Desantisbacteria bacterium CG07_land_8_20_14_0_80_39_15]
MENNIEVTVDKSHLITIGERLYGESIELIRELVNNAYDADATEAHIEIKDEEITISDNGIGMDIEGLKQYFNIGSPYKKIHRKSLRFGRVRIGEFGIGKFAVLSACPYFEVWTKKGNFQGRVIFDKEEWEKTPDVWHLPLQVESVDQARQDGT